MGCTASMLRQQRLDAAATNQVSVTTVLFETISTLKVGWACLPDT
jgi:hypothetical protein